MNIRKLFWFWRGERAQKPFDWALPKDGREEQSSAQEERLSKFISTLLAQLWEFHSEKDYYLGQYRNARAHARDSLEEEGSHIKEVHLRDCINFQIQVNQLEQCEQAVLNMITIVRQMRQEEWLKKIRVEIGQIASVSGKDLPATKRVEEDLSGFVSRRQEELRKLAEMANPLRASSTGPSEEEIKRRMAELEAELRSQS